ARLFDQRHVKVALFGVTLDFGLVERGKTGAFEKTRDRRIRAADARPLALFLQVGLPGGNDVNRQREPPRRRECLCSLVDETLGDEFVGDHAAQIVRRLCLHARRNFFGEKFEKEIGHLRYSPPPACGGGGLGGGGPPALLATSIAERAASGVAKTSLY